MFLQRQVETQNGVARRGTYLDRVYLGGGGGGGMAEMVRGQRSLMGAAPFTMFCLTSFEVSVPQF